MEATPCIYEPVVLWQRGSDDILPKDGDGHEATFAMELSQDGNGLYIDGENCYFNHCITVGVASLGNNFVNFQKVVQVANRLLVFSQMYHIDDGMARCSSASFGSVFERKIVHLDIDLAKVESLIENYQASKLEIIEFIAGASKSAGSYMPKYASDNTSINPETPVIFVENEADFDNVCQEAAQDTRKFDQMRENGNTDKYASGSYSNGIITVVNRDEEKIAAQERRVEEMLEQLKKKRKENRSPPSNMKFLPVALLAVAVVAGISWWNKTLTN